MVSAKALADHPILLFPNTPLKDGGKELFRRFVAAYIVVAPVIALFLIPVASLPVLGAMFWLHCLLYSFTFIPNGSWYGPIVRRFETTQKEVLLTLDDGPDPDATPRVLALLRDYNAKACFMVIGSKVRRYPELAREILLEGHEIANHTDSHQERWFWAELWWGVKKEMAGCTQAIQSATGIRPRWFRSPVGMTNPFVHPTARRLGMRMLGWSARAMDAGEGTDMEAAANRVLIALQPGAIIVLHPEWKRSDGTHPGLVCLERILRESKALGYRCVLPCAPPE
jgi:peptidoglycan/xylan/chitin deacetylase (PgdA/CDA1 family)